MDDIEEDDILREIRLVQYELICKRYNENALWREACNQFWFDKSSPSSSSSSNDMNQYAYDDGDDDDDGDADNLFIRLTD